MSARVVGWTVGPGEASEERLKKSSVHDGYYAGLKHLRAHLVCVWPSKAAALAAGRAFGWKSPVARRVVRR